MRYPDVSSVWQAAVRLVEALLVVRFVELLGPAAVAVAAGPALALVVDALV